MAIDPFARRIATLREERGWSQNYLAERAGIRAADLSRILTGMRGVLPYHVVRLSVALDTSPDALLKGTKLDIDMTTDVPNEQLSQSEQAIEETEQEIERLHEVAAELAEELQKLSAVVADTGHKKPAQLLEQGATRLATMAQTRKAATTPKASKKLTKKR